MMDIHKLKAFVAVVEESNISKAAVRLNMQQPPLTRLIKSLEDEFNTALFKRLPRGVEVTEAGKALYFEAVAILAHVDAIPQKVKNIAEGLEGEINIGFTHSVGLHSFLPNLLRKFREQFPNVSIHLEEESSHTLIDSVRNGTLDLVFLRKPAESDLGLKNTHILNEPLLVALPSNHPLASQQGDLDFKDLATYPFVLYRRLAGQDLFDIIMSKCYEAGFSPKIVQETPRLTTTLNLISAGIGLSIVPKSIQDFWNTQVVYKPLKSSQKYIAPIFAVSKQGEEYIRAKQVLNLLF
ncbi:LysR family transcriptional regulator [Acinetobacter gerneri]|uniref:LysR family transcriptional regulator n=1 Tax=Acinetobacter gerneri TaxID=202952 RepID=UPI002936732F|nr:LysR family transcriptional regulator [Acinetobacter gerneri]MDV2440677.1 LysR family transcriptional regulator [Acinetobacter gerneri]